MRLPERPRPTRYDLALWVDPAKDRFRGECQLELEISPDTRAIELHAVDLELGPCRASDAKGEVAVARIRNNAERETVTLVLD